MCIRDRSLPNQYMKYWYMHIRSNIFISFKITSFYNRLLSQILQQIDLTIKYNGGNTVKFKHLHTHNKDINRLTNETKFNYYLGNRSFEVKSLDVDFMRNINSVRLLSVL